MSIPSAALAYWNQRAVLANDREQIMTLIDTVGRPTDLTHFQWTQLMAMALEFKPNIILELGRGWGNSTCAFTQVANWLQPYPCQVLSLCLSKDWESRTLPKIGQIVPEAWFSPLRPLRENILDFDFKVALAGFDRILVFWDAHGYEVAECVLGQILPEIAGRPHLVLMHDLTDARYMPESDNDYGGHRLWKGNSWAGPRVRVGHILSPVEQAVAITDFTIRNKLPLHSADHSLQTELGRDPAKMAELRELIGEPLFALKAHWFYFSLNEIPGPYTFPMFHRPEPAPSQVRHIPFKSRLKVALKVLLNRYPAEKFLK